MDKSIDEQAVFLARARISVRNLKRMVGNAAPENDVARLVAAFNLLDNEGVFRAIDEWAGYADADSVLKQWNRRSPVPSTDLPSYAYDPSPYNSSTGYVSSDSSSSSSTPSGSGSSSCDSGGF